MRTKTKAAKATATTTASKRTSKATAARATRSGTKSPATPAKAKHAPASKRKPATSKPTRAEREAFVRHVARAKGMDEDALVAAVILDDEDENVDVQTGKRANRCKASRTAPPAPVTIHTFTVSEEWFQITASIPADVAKFLASNPERVRATYGSDVSTFAFAAEREKCGYYAAQISAASKCQGETAEIKIEMEPYAWQSVENAARFYKSSVSAIVQAALTARAKQINAYNKAKARKS